MDIAQRPGPPMGPPRHPGPPPMSGRGASNKGCLASMGCLLGLSILFNLALMAMVGATAGGKQSRSRMQESVISGRGKHKIAVIRLQGTIGAGGSSYRDSPASVVIAKLMRARRDPQVRGVLILANSPGGTVTASDRIHNSMLRLKKSGKPIVVVMGDTCASGCVYATASATKIYAHPTTVTGSIGVLISTLNFSGLLEKYGVKGVLIASKENKALLSPFHPIKEEHKQILKSIVDELFGRFAGILVKWRKIPKGKLSTFADGRVFSARQAKKYGLVDKIGYIGDAKEALLKLAGIQSARYVQYQRLFGLSDFFRGFAKLPHRLQQSTQRPSFRDLLRQSTPKAYYLWTPAGKVK